MYKLKKINTLVLVFLLFLNCKTEKKSSVEITPKYGANWESLSKHNEEPEWFKDAKFGIYFHWGIYSVPAYGSEWYPRWMHFPDHAMNKHHIETYGPLDEFGYHDFVPMFTAEKFDAKQWAELFKKAGAKFAGPVAEHHDGFAMWDSEITPWNTMDKGPKRDITGELQKEIAKNEMKFITTFHHARQLQRYKGKEEEELAKKKWNFSESHFALFPNTAPTIDDEELNLLYGNIEEEKWEEEIWFGKLKEVIDKYNPDILWFDSWLDRISEEKRKKFAAYYLNKANERNKEVVIVRKQDDLPLDFSVDDLEKSRKNKMGKKVWMTDETISKGSWSYTENLKIKSGDDVLHTLIDIVSKNGVLLLNISPKANGEIPQNQQEVLLKIGDWLTANGESIYATRPWYTFGEGPTKEPEGHFKNHKEFLKVKYSSKDVRYTTSKDSKTIYCTTLGVPKENEELNFTAFAKTNLPKPIQIKSVKLLDRNLNVDWNLSDDGLTIKSPKIDSDEMAVVFRVELK